MSLIAEQTHEVSPETLMAFLDEEPTARERTAVERHVADCRECQQMLDGQKVLRLSLDAWTVPSVPAHVEERVLAATAGEAVGQGRRRLLWLRKPLLVGLGSSLATVAILVALLSNTREAHVMRRIEPEAPVSPLASTAPSISKEESVEKYLDARREEMQALLARRQQAELSESLARSDGGRDTTPTPDQSPTEPMIARTASVVMTVKKFPDARAALDALLTRHHGYAAELAVSTEQNAPRSLQASLRIPAKELAAALVELKALGEVQTESQGGEEVTQQHADLVARLKNARQTEQRLASILQQRTGKIGGVLEVEREIARVRGEIEQMEADQRGLEHRVQFATVDLKLNEEYRAALGTPSPSVGTRLRNAAVQGLQDVAGTILGISLFLIQTGPSLMLWLAILVLPLRFVWKRRRQWFAHGV